MRAKVVWKEKMEFLGTCGEHNLVMDSKAPLGGGRGFSPKELVVVGIAGCTAMDVISLMKKYKQQVDSFEISTEVTQTTGGYPAVFKDVQLVYEFKGPIDGAKAIEAVQLSQTKYCGVSAMISKVAPIQYKVLLNGVEIGQGHAQFSI